MQFVLVGSGRAKTRARARNEASNDTLQGQRTQCGVRASKQ